MPTDGAGGIEVSVEGIAVGRVYAVIDDDPSAPPRPGPAGRQGLSSVTRMSTSCSVWSTWLTIGTTLEIAPPLAMDFVDEYRQVRIAGEIPKPPMPFIIRVPQTWVELTLP